RVNQACAVLEHNNSCDATNKKTTQGADPAVPREPGQCWQDEADHDGEQMNMSMLLHDQRIFLYIVDVNEGRWWQELEQKPANVGEQNNFDDVVREYVLMYMFRMAAM